MARFKVHTLSSAPTKSKEILEKEMLSTDNLSNFIGILAESPIALQAYGSLTELFSKSSLKSEEQKIILLIISQEYRCDYNIAMLSQSAKQYYIPDEIISAIKDEKPLHDMRLNALRKFVLNIMTNKGKVSAEDVEKFLSLGYTQQNILEIITAISLQTLSNYTNLIARTPIDTKYKNKIASVEQ